MFLRSTIIRSGALSRTKACSWWKRALSADAAAIGDRVHLHYKFESLMDSDDAMTIDSRVVKGGRPDIQTTGQPLTCTLGAGQTMRSLEEAAIGMSAGGTKKMTLEPLQAFGNVAPDVRVPISQLPKEIAEKLSPGLPILTQHGHVVVVKSIDSDAEDVVFDPNHPLAGHRVQCEVEVMKVEDASSLPFAEQLVLPIIETDNCKAGDGETFPRRGDTCVMHYCGRLLESGEKFDSSRDRGSPFEFTIGMGQVIGGWDEGVMHMSKGQRSLLKIPSVKAYGERGAGEAIPPNADLVFDVELVDIRRHGEAK